MKNFHHQVVKKVGSSLLPVAYFQVRGQKALGEKKVRGVSLKVKENWYEIKHL